MVKSRKLKYSGHILRHTSLEKDIMLDTMLGLRRQGGQRKEWSDDLVEWTGKTITGLGLEGRGQIGVSKIRV